MSNMSSIAHMSFLGLIIFLSQLNIIPLYDMPGLFTHSPIEGNPVCAKCLMTEVQAKHLCAGL